MSAELSAVTKHKGVCANWTPDNPKLPRKEDMFFHSDDYPAVAGAWEYDRWNSLSFRLNSDDADRSMPSEIEVRCYDWGGYAMLTFTFKKKTGNNVWTTFTDTHSIPIDKNENQIADGWETESTLKVVLSNGKTGYDPEADGERITELLGQNYLDTWPGDAWTIADEYRGLFKERTDADIKRLDPMKKEVIVSPEDTSDPKDMWSYGTGSEVVPEHELVKVHPDFVNRPFDNAEGVFVWKKKDIGWVNFNSERKRVYAIRIKEDDTHTDGIHVGGESPHGSPAPESITYIFIGGIEKKLDEDLDDVDIIPTDTQRRDGIDLIVGKTISHEIGHSLNLEHCSEKSCLMYQDEENPEETLNYGWKEQGLVSKRGGFKRHNLNEHYYAVTGAPITKTRKSYIYISIEAEADEEANSENEISPTVTLSPSNGSYSASAGDSHTIQLSLSEPYYDVSFYVRAPGETSGRGSYVGNVSGDGTSTTASWTYTFPTGVSGDYVITAALIYRWSDMSLIDSEPSYTVSVSGSSVSVPVWRSVPSSYDLTVGDSFSLDLSSYVSGYESISIYSGSLPSGLSFNSGSISGTVTTAETQTLQFSANNSAGYSYSGWVSITVSAASMPVAPSAPSGLTATYGNAEVTLSWTAPTSSGSSDIIRYEYRYATGQYPNHSAFTSWTSTGSTSTFYVVTGLTNGTQYLFQVRAVNNDNMKSGTTNTAFSTPRAPVAPTAPSSLTARRGTGQVTLSWTAPTSSGSSDIIRYEYRYATGQYPNHSAFTSWTSIGSTSTTYVVTGLTSGTQHLFQVRAVNNDNMESGTTNTAFSTPQ